MMEIFCCECNGPVKARLTSGHEIYPHRADLHDLPFWRCDTCRNYVGCHHKTKNPTRPLGCIPNREIKAARQRIHRIIDPLWQNNKIARWALYAELGKVLGREYHTADVRTTEEAQLVYEAALKIKARLLDLCGAA